MYNIFPTGVPLAGSCTNTTNCTASTVNSECKGGTCQCKIAFYAQNKTCVASKYCKEGVHYTMRLLSQSIWNFHEYLK